MKSGLFALGETIYLGIYTVTE